MPSGEPFEDLEINDTLQDSRFIPITQEGNTIKKKLLKQYLEERLREYYWDLWGNLEHLREAYQEYLGENLFGPSSDKEEEEGEVDNSAVSWDTQ
jgi:hypothetical protein